MFDRFGGVLCLQVSTSSGWSATSQKTTTSSSAGCWTPAALRGAPSPRSVRSALGPLPRSATARRSIWWEGLMQKWARGCRVRAGAQSDVRPTALPIEEPQKGWRFDGSPRPVCTGGQPAHSSCAWDHDAVAHKPKRKQKKPTSKHGHSGGFRPATSDSAWRLAD